jgi:hypothetical protein
MGALINCCGKPEEEEESPEYNRVFSIILKFKNS